MKNYYQFSAEEVKQDINGKQEPLTAAEVKAHQEKFGPNELVEGKKKTTLQIFLEQYKDFLVIILIAAAIVSGFLGDAESAIVILIVITINAILGTGQTVKAEQSLASLKKLSGPEAKVLRDGSVVPIPSAEVTVGDIVMLDAGDYIPADGRLLESASLKVDESALTGESLGVEKMTDAIEGEVPLGDRTNMVYSGSFVTYGRGSFVVTGIGMETEVGKIASLLKTTSEKKTPLQVNLDQFGQKLSIIILVFCGILFGINVFRGGNIGDAFLFAVALAVAAIPEALSSIVTIVLSFGTQKMAKEHAIIRKLQAVEGLGSVSIICSDKTGTLTKGVFKVSKINANVGEKKFLEMAVVAEMYSNHPIAKSLKDELINKDKSVFDGIQARQKDIKIEEIHGRGIKAELDGSEILAGNGKLLDMFKIPYEKTGEIGTIVYVAVDNQYLGYAVIEDTVKETSLETIKQLKALGVKNTVMLTGDRKEIAEKIAKELNLDSVYSELLPEDKVRHVEELLKTSGVLAFVGDGVNDAPVLARADIGIAMGAMGSDAAIEAADIVLMDDNPKNIGKAIKIGRKTMGIAKQNIIFALAVKILVLILAAVGIASMWAAVFADVGVCVVAILNAMRAGKIK